jgi:uncharacterized membrane protein YfcA
MLMTLILLLIVIINVFFAYKLICDFIIHKDKLLKEPANNWLLATTLPIIFFFSSFGISDFAISMVFYRKMKLLNVRDLLGTLNTQCVIPVAAMAFAFISVISVDIVTLFVCIIAQTLGAYIGPRFVVKTPSHIIKKIMGVGLVIATLFILAGKFNWLASGGIDTELNGVKLIIAAVSLFIFGALNTIGIGSYAPTMITIYALGMNPVAAFPIMMAASAFSVPISSIEFIRYGHYNRKITLFAATFGLLGVFIGVYFVKELDVAILQWIVAAILLYSGLNMLIKPRISKKNSIKHTLMEE